MLKILEGGGGGKGETIIGTVSMPWNSARFVMNIASRPDPRNHTKTRHRENPDKVQILVTSYNYCFLNVGPGQGFHETKGKVSRN